jgi:hypothetical protein
MLLLNGITGESAGGKYQTTVRCVSTVPAAMAWSYHDIASLLRTLSFAPKPLANDKKFCAESCFRQPGQMKQDSLFSSALVVEFRFWGSCRAQRWPVETYWAKGIAVRP